MQCFLINATWRFESSLSDSNKCSEGNRVSSVTAALQVWINLYFQLILNLNMTTIKSLHGNTACRSWLDCRKKIKRRFFFDVVTIDKIKCWVDKIQLKCLIISSGHNCPIPWSKQQSPQSSNTEPMCRFDLWSQKNKKNKIIINNIKQIKRFLHIYMNRDDKRLSTASFNPTRLCHNKKIINIILIINILQKQKSTVQ